MSYVLVVQSRSTARNDAPPFVPDSMIMESLYGVQVFGPYPTVGSASKALRKFPSGWGNVKVTSLRSLTEDVENPYAALWHGDAPDE
jgi:hypothetical protein